LTSRIVLPDPAQAMTTLFSLDGIRDVSWNNPLLI
jgi:hypothetical protein